MAISMSIVLAAKLCKTKPKPFSFFETIILYSEIDGNTDFLNQVQPHHKLSIRIQINKMTTSMEIAKLRNVSQVNKGLLLISYNWMVHRVCE